MPYLKSFKSIKPHTLIQHIFNPEILGSGSKDNCYDFRPWSSSDFFFFDVLLRSMDFWLIFKGQKRPFQGFWGC
jgi:hypothetical protein